MASTPVLWMSISEACAPPARTNIATAADKQPRPAEIKLFILFVPPLLYLAPTPGRCPLVGMLM
jgi:hypothetical protein